MEYPTVEINRNAILEKRSFVGQMIKVQRLTETVQPCNPQDIELSVSLVKLPEWDRVQDYLKGFLSSGVLSSRTREKERVARFTPTVCLHLPNQPGKDVIFEVLIHPSFGECITEVSKRSTEELKNMLGDYIFTAMESSKMREEEQMMGDPVHTHAVSISEDCSGDSKLRVWLNFDKGMSIWRTAFPTS